MDDICSICFEKQNSTSIALPCLHFLHKNCLENFYKKTTICKCPICRQLIPELFLENYFPKDNCCKICNLKISQEENDCNNIQLMDCNCQFHYECWKTFLQNQFPDNISDNNICPNNPNIECPHCKKLQPYYNINARNYSYLYNGHLTWIGEIEPCRHKYCIYNGNPQKYGYCQIHAKNKASNRVIKNTLRFFVKTTPHWNLQKKMQHFYKILKFCNKYDVNMDIDLPRIASNIQ